MHKLLSITLLVVWTLLSWGNSARAESVPVDVDTTFTSMDYHAGTIDIDPNNGSLPNPTTTLTSSLNSLANASISATAGEAGVATASVGLNIEWDTGDQTWEEVKDIPVEVRISFRYTLTADWEQRTGSSNAGVSVNRLESGWFDFIGHRGQISEPARELVVVSYATTPALIGDRIWLTAYTQAHVSPTLTNTNASAASVAINYIRFRWRPPEPEMEATGLEVTQAIQDLDNSVDLVAGKRTFVRFYARSTTDSAYRSTASLLVEGPTASRLLLPVNPGREIRVQPNPSRGMLNHAFLFELPTSLTTGNVRLTAELNPGNVDLIPRTVEERFYGNNTQTVDVAFNEVPPLHIVFQQVSYDSTGRTWSTPFSHVREAVRWLEAAFPISSLIFRSRTHSYTRYFVSSLPRCDRLNSDLSSKRWWDKQFGAIGFGVPGDVGARYYGLVTDLGFEATFTDPTSTEQSMFMRGCSLNIPALIGSGPTGMPRTVRIPNSNAAGETATLRYQTWDRDSTYGDWYTAHELGHQYGRRHPGHCQQTRDAGHPNGDHASGLISPIAIGDTALYGFDVRSRALYGPQNWYDVMTYCQNQWISDFTFEGLMATFQTIPVAAAKSAATKSAATKSAATKSSATKRVSTKRVGQDYLLVTGLVDQTNDEVTLDPLFVVPNLDDVEEPVAGPYTIVLRDIAGAELVSYPFAPLESDYGPPAPGQPTEGNPRSVINVAVPFITGTVQVDVSSGMTTLASIKPGSTTPTVTLLSPTGGETIDGESVMVTWSGSDPDDDELVYHVQYSSDNGQSWEMVEQFVVGGSAAISRTNLIASNESLFRVWVTDGLHTSSDISTVPITVTNQLPEVAIISPISGTTVFISETVPLEAFAYDPDTGSMEDSQLTWHSDIDGKLGEGDQLSIDGLTIRNLFFGTEVHTISLVADDGAGGVITNTLKLTVVSKPSLLPTVPHKLLTDPSEVRLEPSQGVWSTTIFVDNENPKGFLGWQTQTSNEWIKIDDSSGETPSQFNVSLDSSGLSSGIYTGTVTITSIDVTDTITIPVQLTLGEDVPVADIPLSQSVFIPLVQR